MRVAERLSVFVSLGIQGLSSEPHESLLHSTEPRKVCLALFGTQCVGAALVVRVIELDIVIFPKTHRTYVERAGWLVRQTKKTAARAFMLCH